MQARSFRVACDHFTGSADLSWRRPFRRSEPKWTEAGELDGAHVSLPPARFLALVVDAPAHAETEACVQQELAEGQERTVAERQLDARQQPAGVRPRA